MLYILINIFKDKFRKFLVSISIIKKFFFNMFLMRFLKFWCIKGKIDIVGYIYIIIKI